MNNVAHVFTKGSEANDNKVLYKIGAMAAFIAAGLFRRNLDVEWMALRRMGIIHIGPSAQPNTIAEWFTLLQQNTLLGLTLLNLFDLINYILVGFIFLATIIALWQASPSWSLIAAAFGFTGIIAYIASNQAFTLLSLSNQYAAATTAAQRQLLLEAGQAVLAIHQNSGYAGSGIYLSYLFVSIAGLIISIVMLHGSMFNQGTAIMGFLANGIGLTYYIALVLVPRLVSIPLSISAIFLLVWYLLTGIRLWSLSSSGMVISKRANAACHQPAH